MPKVLLSFDAHDGGKGGRATFIDELKARKWIDFSILDGQYCKLPDTTLRTNKTRAAVEADIAAAARKAKKADTEFALTRFVYLGTQAGAARDINKRPASALEKITHRMAMASEKTV